MEVLPHHVKQEVCATRAPYRDSKTPKVVKVYTCAQESRHVLCTSIPSLGVHNELVDLFAVYGAIDEHKMLDEYPCAVEFTETMLVSFAKIQHARTAKIKLDNYNFYGGSLHVCYAPEYETVDDLRNKLAERQYIVDLKCKKYESMRFGTVEYELKQSRMRDNFGEFKSEKRRESKPKATAPTATTSRSVPVGPELPPGWIRQTHTGDLSYDLTVNEINNQMKRTIPAQEQLQELKRKRKKTLRL